MENKRGRWYWLCVANVFILFLAARGSLGEEAQQQSEVAPRDLSYAVFRLRYVLIAIATVLVAAIVVLLLEATR